MKELRLAYFDKLGEREIATAKDEFEKKHPAYRLRVQACSHDQAFSKLKEQEADLVLNDLRPQEKEANFKKEKLTDLGLMAVLQKETYPAGMQVIEKDDLRDLTCFLVCSPAEEKEELTLHQDLWHIKSPLIAVANADEAAVLVSSGSGYFIMNELAASLISNDTLQKLFLLDHGRQMQQHYYLFWRKDNPMLNDLITILKDKY